MAFTASSTVWAYRTASVPDYNAAHTLTFWARFPAFTGGAGLVSIAGELYQQEDQIELFNPNTFAALAVYSGFTATADFTFSLDTWYFVAMVREDTSTLRLYVGTEGGAATLIGTATRSIVGRVAPLWISLGARSSSGDNPADVLIDSGKQWTKALSGAGVEAERLYQNPQDTGSLWANWPLQTDGSDGSGNSRPLTLAGTPSYVTGPTINRGAVDEIAPAQVGDVLPALPALPVELLSWLSLPIPANAAAGAEAATRVIDDQFYSPPALTPWIDASWIAAPADEGGDLFATLNDTAVSTDTASGAYATTQAESSTGADTATGLYAGTLDDAGTGADALAAQTGATLADSAAGTDVASGAYATTTADTGTGIDGMAGAGSSTLAENGSGADVLAAQQGASVDDTATGTDTSAGDYAATLAESGTATDAAVAQAGAALADTGTGTETIAGLLVATLSDSGIAVDNVSASGDGGVTVGDSGTGADTAGAAYAALLADTATSTDALSSSQSATVADTATGLDALTALYLAVLSEAGAALDAVTGIVPPISDDVAYSATLRSRAPLGLLATRAPIATLTARDVPTATLRSRTPIATLSPRRPVATLSPRV